MADPYISRKEATSSWRPQSGLMSLGLKRAREPFRFRNAFTGAILFSFAVGVWAYSISAVKQDVFDDVDEEARALAKAREQSLVLRQQDVQAQTKEKVEAESVTVTNATSIQSAASSAPDAAGGRGILPALLDKRFPKLLDPSTKTLVWGAPPVDHIGRIWDGTRWKS